MFQCDSARYPCSRCRRLNIPCIGLGQQRYKFMNDTQSSDSDSVTPNSPRRARPSSQVSRERSTQASAATPVVFWSLSNDHTRRVGAFVDKIKPSTGVKFNLAWTFGNYLVDVPARLGTNDALDKAADAVLTALERFSFSGTPGQMTPRMLEKYTLALAALRTSLDDSVAAKSCETLCAIMLLLMCQVRNCDCPSVSVSEELPVPNSIQRHFSGHLQQATRPTLEALHRSSDYAGTQTNVSRLRRTCFLPFVELW